MPSQFQPITVGYHQAPGPTPPSPFANLSPAAVAAIEADRTREKVRTGPRDIVVPWFLPYYDPGSPTETLEMRRAYRQMIAEPNVKAPLLNKLFAVASLDLHAQPASDSPRDREIADFVVWNLTRRCKGAVHKLVEAIAFGALIDGFSVSEKVWAIERQNQRWKGKTILRTLKPKDVDEDLTLKVDEFRNVVGIEGRRFNAGQTFAPRDFVILQYLSIFDSPAGISDLRAAYGRWWMLDTVLKLRGMALQKRSLPVLKGEYDTKDHKAALEAALEDVKSSNWLTIPTGVKVEALEIAGGGDAMFASAIKDLKHDIFLAIAGAILQSLEGNLTGSRAMGKVHAETSDLYKWYLAVLIADALNDPEYGLVPDLVQRNYRGAEPPLVTLEGIDEAALKDSLLIDQGMQTMGLPLSRKELYKRYGRSVPTAPDDELPAPAPQPPQPPGAPGGGAPAYPFDEPPQPGAAPAAPALPPPPSPAPIVQDLDDQAAATTPGSVTPPASLKPAKSGDQALAGPDGAKASDLLRNSKEHGIRVLADISKAAVARLAANPKAAASATSLYTEEEKQKLADALASVTATAELLGRARIRKRQEQAERVQAFASFVDGEKIFIPEPDEIQDSDYDCGSSALASVCKYFGVGPGDEDLVERDLGTDPIEGTRPSEIIRVARQYGLEPVEQYDMTLSDLFNNLRRGRPVITPIQLYGGGHYVVVCGLDVDDVEFMDPSQGQNTLSQDQFLSVWHDTDADGKPFNRYGIAFGFAPPEKFSEVPTDLSAFTAFAEIEPMPPAKALDYFKSLVPKLGIDPERFGIDQRRQAFTLAADTEGVVLDKVKDLITNRLETGAAISATPKLIDQILSDAGLSVRNAQYSEMVFRTNMMDAYTQGAQEEYRDPDVQSYFPAWKYLGIMDGRQGADHEPHFGRYFPAETSFAEVRGPRIFNCRCNFQVVDKHEWRSLQDRGATFSTFSECGQGGSGQWLCHCGGKGGKPGPCPEGTRGKGAKGKAATPAKKAAPAKKSAKPASPKPTKPPKPSAHDTAQHLENIKASADASQLAGLQSRLEGHTANELKAIGQAHGFKLGGSKKEMVSTLRSHVGNVVLSAHQTAFDLKTGKQGVPAPMQPKTIPPIEPAAPIQGRAAKQWNATLSGIDSGHVTAENYQAKAKDIVDSVPKEQIKPFLNSIGIAGTPTSKAHAQRMVTAVLGQQVEAKAKADSAGKSAARGTPTTAKGKAAVATLQKKAVAATNRRKTAKV